MKDMLWYSSNFLKNKKKASELVTERQLFKRYTDNINSTVSGEPEKLLGKVNNPHEKLKFTFEVTGEKTQFSIFRHLSIM